MMKDFIARQLVHPSGWLGRHVLPRLWNRRNAALNDGALRHLRLSAADRVLEVGFGGGYLLERMLETVTAGRVSGVDASETMVAVCRKRFARQLAAGRLDLQRAKADHLPYPDGSFDKVGSVNSFFYWSDAERGFREIHRVLSVPGTLVLAYTCERDLDKRGWAPYGIRSFADEEVTRMLRDQGFRDINLERKTDAYRAFSILTAIR